MIRLKNEKEIAGIRESGRLLAGTLEELKKLVAPGISTHEMDSFARSWIESHGGKPAFLGYMNYPASLCVSLNNEVIHGIPGPRKLRQGDIVSIDLGVDLNGYFSDAAITIAVGATTRKRERLAQITRECLERGLAQALPGNRISDISRAVYEHAVRNTFGVVREYCGHGTGFAMHEDPQVPNYRTGQAGRRIEPGLCLAIEPMFTLGSHEAQMQPDDWTIVTRDGSLAAHFEHSITITEHGPEILTTV